MVDDSVVVDDSDEIKIVTKFLLETCRVRQPSEHSATAASIRAGCAAIDLDIRGSNIYVRYRTTVGDEGESIPLISGSSAEFYIQPMLSYVGDVDVMMHRSTVLAIPEGYPPPTELPAEFHSRVEVHEIIDSEYPGYVYLLTSYLLTEDSDTGKYNVVHCDNPQLVSHRSFHLHLGLSYMGEIHGPALSLHDEKSELPIDGVYCVRSLWWPSQASGWPTRHRDYGWPDSATVDRVVSNGCDVVQLADHQCRGDKKLNWSQYRLSFSRAEIKLLNSWTTVQQIVYHALRVFAKSNELTGSSSSERAKLSNYHIKTLTLWACELKPQSWWIDDANVVRICVELFHSLADCLRNESFWHYFVNDCNLLDNTVQWEIIASQLSSITQSWLSTWFVDNYLRKHVTSTYCPGSVLRLFDDVSDSMKLQNAVSAFVEWRRNNSLHDLWNVFNEFEYYVSRTVSTMSLTVRSSCYWIGEIGELAEKIDLNLRDYFIAVAFLHIAIRTAKDVLNDQEMDVLATAVGQFVGKRRFCIQLSSASSLRQAKILMKVEMNTSFSSPQQISTKYKLSMEYLCRALRCQDPYYDSIYCLANVYLAVLYYTSGQYQTAIDHSTLVMKSQDHSQCSSHAVEGDLLPKIDDDIDTVLGLAVFYQYVRTAALNQQQQTQYVSVFTTELFAYYLHIKCLSVVNCGQFTQLPLTEEVQRHSKYILDTDQLLISDVLLLKSVTILSEHNCHYNPSPEQCQRSTPNADEPDTSELLQRSAIEHLTTFHQRKAQHFGSVTTIVTTDFEALYAYKRGGYQRCLQLSTQNVQTLLHCEYSPSVSTFPEFIQLMDDDIVSLIAVTLIVNPLCRHNAEYGACIAQLTLSLYLLAQCQLKLHHSEALQEQTLGYIEDAQRECPLERTLDHLILKLTESKVKIFLKKTKIVMSV